MLTMYKVSIIIPTYNEVENISRLISELLVLNIFKESNKYTLEVVVVDDNSPDKTAVSVRSNFARDKRVRILVRKSKRDLGSAILEGIKMAKGEIIIGMDADLTHSPDDIADLLKGLLKSDLVVASRFVKGGGTNDVFRKFPTLIFNIVLNKIFGFPIKDNTSGYYAIRKNKLNMLPLNFIYRDYGEYHLRLLYLAKSNKFKINEIPSFFPKRVRGKSKSNLLIMFFSYLWVAFSLKVKNKLY